MVKWRNNGIIKYSYCQTNAKIKELCMQIEQIDVNVSLLLKDLFLK